ncbi:MAG: bifunctional 5,10-methylene-tetrahydrofolate dehydrogenase/5,10-methylene-tetrahydrofolate cyclohydrolase [Coriobacteriales bacterium]|jgi:methylenetetrahydrofolate dehydrogenase (NADP+)/methenyltetrahydrofolate cyclohydrolase|nr:bifunctional 5,10-methylene-tetrahydrofolate dehydrogenase/5,10-methylene-tetrahydrofolate cyclohydrolase [Coriobacteriales bacterium]
MAMILNGTEVAEALDAKTSADGEKLKRQGIEPSFAIVRVGDHGEDVSYERGVMRRADKVGIGVRNVLLPADAVQEELLGIIRDLNADPAIHGVLLFRPLPEHIDENAVRSALAPAKDIDGTTDLSLAGVFTGTNIGYAPCTPAACMEILDYFAIPVKGKKAVVIGRSLVVGKPVAMMLLNRHATVTIAHSRTTDLPSVVREADLVIAATGRAKMIDASYLRAGQTVIDVGINFVGDGLLVGDVDFGAATDVVSAITPVPGGVGAVTTSVLVRHVIDTAMQTPSR